MNFKKFFSITAVAALMVSCAGNKTDENKDSVQEDSVITVATDTVNPADTAQALEEAAEPAAPAPETAAQETAKETKAKGKDTKADAKDTKAEPAKDKAEIVKENAKDVVKKAETVKTDVSEAKDKMTDKLNKAKAGAAAATDDAQSKKNALKDAVKK